MKSIITLSAAAITLTISAYLFCVGNLSSSAQAGGEKYITDLVETKKAAPLAEKAPAVLVAKPGPNAMREALANNDVCAVEKLIGDKDVPEPQDVLAFLDTIDASSRIGEYLAKEGPLLAANAPNKKYSYKASRLFLALKLGGLAYSIGSKQEDPKASRKLLLSLEKEDPQNGLLPFFRLAVEKKLKLATKVQLKTAESFVRATKFENYLDEITEEIWDLQWQSPSHYRFLASWGAWLTQEGDFSHPTGALKSLSPFLYKESLKKMGLMMKQKAAASSAPFWAREYSVDQYIAGADLAGDPNQLEIYNLSAERESVYGKQLKFPDLKYSGGHCDSRAYEEYFYSQRAAN